MKVKSKKRQKKLKKYNSDNNKFVIETKMLEINNFKLDKKKQIIY